MARGGPPSTSLDSPASTLTAIVFSCVYTSILDDVIETLQYFPWAGTSRSSTLFPESLADASFAGTRPGFAALRAYALSRNRPLAVAVFVLSNITIVVNLVSLRPPSPCKSGDD